MSVFNKNRSGCREHHRKSSTGVGTILDGGGGKDEAAGGGEGGINTNGRIEGGDDDRKGNGKRVSLLRLRKLKKSVQRNKERNSAVVPRSFGTVASSSSGGNCCLCLRFPRPADLSSDSQSSDPNSPDFSHELLSSLIEKNDFYSKECNPHLDVQFPPS
ncbi:hypothetical protein DM860_015593 [Cuscuta australis]|uniref:Uncharacterized protein n=1 Tax=Cuscuta australis TaxID=267555 RepID=A0A328DJG7_9ASTE|nr:hypothetical protein DM860_015593 [Cuscuta australis]